MSQVIVNIKTGNAVRQNGGVRHFTSPRAGAIALASVVRKSKTGETKADFRVMSYAEFEELFDPLVETKNLMNPDGGPVMIRRSQQGGCTDPGSETYWSM